jgi:hypothetical protein
MRCDDVCGLAFGYAGATDDEGDVDVFFIAACLSQGGSRCRLIWKPL